MLEGLPENPAEALQKAKALCKTGQFDQAEAICHSVLQLHADHPDALMMMGILASAQNRLNEAMNWTDRAIAKAPTQADLQNNRGVILLRQGKPNEAVAAFCRAVELRADFVDAFLNIATVFRNAKMTAQELDALGEAIRIKPDMPVLRRLLGRALNEVKRHGEAADAYRKAIELSPGYAEAHNGLGVSLGAVGKDEESIPCFREAIRLNPQYAQPHNNLGAAFIKLCRFTEAMPECEHAVRIEPDYARAQLNRALLLLMTGNFKAAWPAYEWRWAANNVKPPEFVFPKWEGQDLHDRSILLCAEQGLGDTIQFVRYASLLADRGARVVIQCAEQLKPVIASVPGVADVVPEGQPTGTLDFYLPLASLPGVLETELKTIPGTVPYIFSDALRVGAWHEKFGDPVKLRVGLVWAGGAYFPNDRNRSMQLAELAPFAAVENVEFHSIQKGEAAAEASRMPRGLHVIDHANELRDLGETAALLANLDLLISVDTSVLHLAGAMARPAWALLPFSPDWRWMPGRSRSPWYPTIRLFRQPAPRDWPRVIRTVAKELAAVIARRGTAH